MLNGATVWWNCGADGGAAKSCDHAPVPDLPLIIAVTQPPNWAFMADDAGALRMLVAAGIFTRLGVLIRC